MEPISLSSTSPKPLPLNKPQMIAKAKEIFTEKNRSCSIMLGCVSKEKQEKIDILTKAYEFYNEQVYIHNISIFKEELEKRLNKDVSVYHLAQFILRMENQKLNSWKFSLLLSFIDEGHASEAALKTFIATPLALSLVEASLILNLSLNKNFRSVDNSITLLKSYLKHTPQPWIQEFVSTQTIEESALPLEEIALQLSEKLSLLLADPAQKNFRLIFYKLFDKIHFQTKYPRLQVIYVLLLHIVNDILISPFNWVENAPVSAIYLEKAKALAYYLGKQTNDLNSQIKINILGGLGFSLF